MIGPVARGIAESATLLLTGTGGTKTRHHALRRPNHHAPYSSGLDFEEATAVAYEPTVFVVDDDELARKSVCALVRSMGVRAATFASAEIRDTGAA